MSGEIAIAQKVLVLPEVVLPLVVVGELLPRASRATHHLQLNDVECYPLILY
jgi:hypothetical protein